jgi:UDP-4-amino-4,6-dideoxy-N-acetyl-beta-L-altrosamine transaminase
MIPYGRQEVTQNDIQEVVSVLQSDFLTQGSIVPKFEKAVSAYSGALHGVATNSATSALHIACMALKIGPGDVVWTSPNTFLASANCAKYCGADVDFVDINPQTYNMSLDALAKKLEKAELINKLPKLVIAVHFAGQSCEMREVKKLSEQYGFYIIEDASHAIGGTYLGENIGNCKYSDITVFSFHPVKIITTGEGGMAVTNNPDLAFLMDRSRNHGLTRDPLFMEGPSDGPWYYQQINLGFNYRLTDIQAALGLSQLERLDSYVQQRREIANYYQDRLINMPIVLPFQSINANSAWHLFPIKLKNKHQRLRVFEGMRAANIGVNVHYIPVHMQPYYRHLGFNIGDFPECEAYYEREISLPIYPALEKKQQDYVIKNLQELLK